MSKKNKKEEKKGYVAELDELLLDLGEVEGTDLFAEVKSYDGGPAKVSVFRKVGKEKQKRVQVCRLDVEASLALSEFLKGKEDELAEHVSDPEE